MIGEDCISDGSFMADMDESDFSTDEFRAQLGFVNTATYGLPMEAHARAERDLRQGESLLEGLFLQLAIAATNRLSETRFGGFSHAPGTA